MAVPTFYRKNPEGVVASANYGDIIAGRSYVEVEACVSSSARFLTTVTVPSNHPTAADGRYSTAAANLDEDYDIKLLKPFTIVGDCYVYFSAYSINNSTSTSASCAIYIRKWVEATSTETTIASGSQVYDSENTGAGYQTGKTMSWKFNLPKTHFKIGETLRLTLQSTAPTNSGTIQYFHDPSNRATQGSVTLDTARMVIALPIKADL